VNDTQAIAVVASISGFNAPMGILAEDAKRELGGLGTVEYPFGWPYQFLRFGQDAFVTAVDGIHSTAVPVMIVHGSADESVDYNSAIITAQQGVVTK
jgi:hypothetical protein